MKIRKTQYSFFNYIVQLLIAHDHQLLKFTPRQVGPIVLTINQVYWTAVRNSSLSKLVKLFESMEDIDGEVEVDGKVNEKFEYFAVAYNSENAASI